MDHDRSRPRDKTDPIAQLEQSDRRRRIVQMMFGTAISGALGYVTYPWVAGRRQGEFVDGMMSVVEQLLEDSPGPYAPPEDTSTTATLPVVLDSEGREYEQFLTSLSLRHVQPMAVLRSHFKRRGMVSNCLPPRDSWASMAPTLRVADELQDRLGVRLVEISSAYRSPAYNAMCPGSAAHSYHMRNMALDLKFDCAPEKVVKAAECLRSAGFFAGGIGRYPTFTHVDTRGKAADWG
jgi:hypothetical protein